MMKAILFVLILLTVLLGYLISQYKDIVKEFRRIQSVAPRYIYAIRIAQSAWAAWERPAIARHRKALECRALADQRGLERALIEVAHQKDSGR
jgi:hypothetical protein